MMSENVMGTNDIRKYMLDGVYLALENLQLCDDIYTYRKKINEINRCLEELQLQYEELSNSSIRMFFLKIIGKKEERLQQIQNEIYNKNNELSSIKYEFDTLQARAEVVQQQISEIKDSECLNQIEGDENIEIKKELLIWSDMPRLCWEIGESLKTIRRDISKVQDIYRSVSPTYTRPGIQGEYYNQDSDVKRHNELLEHDVIIIIEKLDTYNKYVPKEIRIDFYDEWLEIEKNLDTQQNMNDIMKQINKIEDFFFHLQNSWLFIKKHQREILEEKLKNLIELMKESTESYAI